MKLCFPVEEDKGLESAVYGHFGSAPVFVIVDSETQAVEVINNQDLGHQHGMCNPLGALDNKEVDAIVVGGIGGGAIRKLNSAGIAVFRAMKGTVQDNMQVYLQNELPELSAADACGGHAGGCNH